LNIISVCATAGTLAKQSTTDYHATSTGLLSSQQIFYTGRSFSQGKKRNDSYSKRLNGKTAANNSSNRKNYGKNEHIVLPPAPYPACFALKISFQLFFTTNKYGILLVVNSYLLINQQDILLVH